MRKAALVLAIIVGMAGVSLASDYTYPTGQYVGPFPLQTAATTGNGKTFNSQYSAALAIRINWGSATTGTLQCQQAIADAGPWALMGPAMAVDTVQHATALNISEPVGIVRCVFTGNADQAVSVALYATPLQ